MSVTLREQTFAVAGPVPRGPLFYAGHARAVWAALTCEDMAVSAMGRVNRTPQNFGRVVVGQLANASTFSARGLLIDPHDVLVVTEFAELPEWPRASVVRAKWEAPPDVLATRDRLQVRGVDTAPVAAEMVDRQTGWDGSDEQFVGDAMGTKSAAVVDGEFTVAAGVGPSRPRPALVWPTPVDLLPEAKFNGSIHNGILA